MCVWGGFGEAAGGCCRAGAVCFKILGRRLRGGVTYKNQAQPAPRGVHVILNWTEGQNCLQEGIVVNLNHVSSLVKMRPHIGHSIVVTQKQRSPSCQLKG